MPSIAFMSSGLSSKLNTWKEGTITLTSPGRSRPPPGQWRTFQLDGDKKSQEDVSVLSFQENSLAPSDEFSPLLSTPSPTLSTSLTLLCINPLSF